jgi:transcriptional regulator with XRE-family HTH domain
MDSSQDIGARLVGLRKQRRLGNGRKLPAADVAAAVGVTRAHISAIETGKDMPGRETARALADYYDVSIDWLISGKSAPAPSGKVDPADAHIAELMAAFRSLPPDEAQDYADMVLKRSRRAR